MYDGTINPEALHLLAQYRPFEDGSAGTWAAHDDLVVTACQTNGGSFPSLEACRSFVNDRLRVELELSEVREARGRLIERGQAVAVGGGLELTAETRAALDAERAAWEQARETALTEWEIAIRRTFPAMPDEHIGTLKDQADPWLDRIVASHGAEVGLLLYPSHPRASTLMDAITKTDLGFLPPCDPDLEPDRATAFRLLVRNPTDAQSEYLGRLLNTGSYLTVLTIDPRVEELARAEMSKVTLYLDTNFLYSVLGVGSTTEAFGARRFLKLCRELGVSLRISPWTADELRTSIASNRQDVERFAQSKKVAAVMAQVSGEKGFGAAYWRAASESGEDVESFFGKFAHFQRFLDHYGIEEHPEGVPEIEAWTEDIRDYASPLEGMYGPGNRPRIVIEHKAKMRLLIEYLRDQQKPAASYTDVRYWFVTESTRLPTYARFGVGGDPRPTYPFCILSSTWAQLLRAMVPRTADLNSMVAALLASPYVGYRSAPRGASQLKAIERIMQSIDSLKDAPPSVAIAVANDRAIATKIGEETDPAIVEQLIAEAMSAKAAELEAQMATAASRIVDAENAQEDARRELKEAEDAQARAEKERDEAIAEAKRHQTEHAAALEAHRAATGELRGTVTDVRDQLSAVEKRAQDERDRRRRSRRNATAVLTCSIVDGAGATLIATGTLSGAAVVLATVAVMAVAIYAAIRIVSQSLAIEVVAVIGIVSAVVAVGSIALAPSADHKTGTTKQSQSKGSATP